MGDTFTIFFERLKRETPVTNQQGLADALGVNRSAVTQAKKLDRIPQKWILQLSRRFGLSPDWLEYGQGAPRPASGKGAAAAVAPAPGMIGVSLPGSVVFSRSALTGGRQGKPAGGGRTVEAPAGLAEAAANPRLFQVPKVSARLSAGGGSFEVEAQVLGSRQFDLDWLRRLGKPADMALMDVTGNSMAPGICDGDTVLVDRGQTDLVFGAVFALGHDDAILIKRVRRAQDGLALVSDNPDFPPILLKGDELTSFRSIGRVVWLCREL